MRHLCHQALFKLDRHAAAAGVELEALRRCLQAHDDAMLVFKLHAAHAATGVGYDRRGLLLTAAHQVAAP